MTFVNSLEASQTLDSMIRSFNMLLLDTLTDAHTHESLTYKQLTFSPDHPYKTPNAFT